MGSPTYEAAQREAQRRREQKTGEFNTESANDRQVAGDHYRREGRRQHWDLMAEVRADYFGGQITKYTERHPKKRGREDLEKALHFAEKRAELYSSAKGYMVGLADPAVVGQYCLDAGLDSYQSVIFVLALCTSSTDATVAVIRKYLNLSYSRLEPEETRVRPGSIQISGKEISVRSEPDSFIIRTSPGGYSTDDSYVTEYKSALPPFLSRVAEGHEIVGVGEIEIKGKTYPMRLERRAPVEGNVAGALSDAIMRAGSQPWRPAVGSRVRVTRGTWIGHEGPVIQLDTRDEKLPSARVLLEGIDYYGPEYTTTCLLQDLEAA